MSDLTPIENAITSWFNVATLDAQFAYVIACGIADRENGHTFWATSDTPSGMALAKDARATADAMRKLADDLAAGRITITRNA